MIRKLIGWLYQHLLKSILFTFDPEKIHDHFLQIGHQLGQHKATRNLTTFAFAYEKVTLNQTIWDINFANPVGLAAGFDKNAQLINILPAVGFGFAEIGSVTLNPYQGNPTPRLYRLPKSQALVVYYGLKNEGVDKIIGRIQSYPTQNFPVSVSVAKTNSAETVDVQTGIADYCATITKLKNANIGNLYTINISCPNTFGGEPYTTPERLDQLLTAIDQLGLTKPILIKMPIDLPWEEFNQLLQIIITHQVSGVVIGNLTKNRDNLLILDQIPKNVHGGISGKPTIKLGNYLIGQTYQNYGNKLKIVGAGGIFSPVDAYEKIRLGASLVQLITGMIYQGPQLIGEINHGLVELMEKDGFDKISQAVGADWR